MNPFPIRLVCFASLAAAATASIACATPRHYKVVDLGSAFTGVLPCINNRGQVSGYRVTDDGYTRPVIYTNGVLIDLPTPDKSYGDADELNDFGETVGTINLPPSASQAYIYSRGKITLIDKLGGPFNVALGLNIIGQAVGYYQTASWAQHGFIYSEGTVTDIGTLGGMYSHAYDINDLGVVTGDASTSNGESYAFIYSHGQMKSLGALGGNQSWAYAINNRSQVTGAASVGGEEQDYHAFLYSHGVMVDLGTLGGNLSSGQDINLFTHVTGFSELADGTTHGFLYADQKLDDLNQLMVGSPGWTVSVGFSINDFDHILCEAFAPDGHAHLVVLKPVYGETTE